MKTIISDISNKDKYYLYGKEALETGCPWLTFGAVLALEHLVNKDFKVLEFGSGGSTIFWAKHCHSVKSFETNPKWFEKVSKRIKKYKNAEIVLASRTETSRAIRSMPDNFYDIVLIDSDPGRSRRLQIANTVAAKIKLGGWLVIDNYQKHGMNDFNYSGWKVYTFDDFGYGGLGTRICKKIDRA